MNTYFDFQLQSVEAATYHGGHRKSIRVPDTGDTLFFTNIRAWEKRGYHRIFRVPDAGTLKMLIEKAAEIRGVRLPEPDYAGFEEVWSSPWGARAFRVGTGSCRQTCVGTINISPPKVDDLPAWLALINFLEGSAPAWVYETHQFLLENDLVVQLDDKVYYQRWGGWPGHLDEAPLPPEGLGLARRKAREAVHVEINSLHVDIVEEDAGQLVGVRVLKERIKIGPTSDWAVFRPGGVSQFTYGTRWEYGLTPQQRQPISGFWSEAAGYGYFDNFGAIILRLAPGESQEIVLLDSDRNTYPVRMSRTPSAVLLESVDDGFEYATIEGKRVRYRK